MIRINFLYWNINNLDGVFENALYEVIAENKIDVLILAENENITSSKISKHTGLSAVALKAQNKQKKWVQIFYKLNDDYRITHHSEYAALADSDGNDIEEDENTPPAEGRLVNRIQVFKIFGKVQDTFFACIHFPSKLYHDEITHLQVVPNYNAKIRNLTMNSNRVFIVGDFNMNPFDVGMVEPAGFFAHNNRELARKDVKFKFGANRALYYNPCWTLLGDFVNNTDYGLSRRTGGSFYHEEPKSRAFHWYLIDQVILRQSLIDEFDSKYLRIIENEYLINELTRKKVGVERKVDHFPLRLAFSFNIR